MKDLYNRILSPNLELITKFGDFLYLKIRPLSIVKRIFSNVSISLIIVVISLL